MSIATYYWPGQVHAGFGAAGLLAENVAKQGATAVFLITDAGVRQAGLLNAIESSLAAANIAVTLTDQIPGNPDVASVDKAAAAYRASNAQLIVAVGGGSVIDAAKAVRLLVGGPASASIAEYALILGDEARPIPSLTAIPPMIAIPTTAGTGAEVTPWGVITDNQTKRKFGVGGVETIPAVALLDPALTLTLPQTLTAATGMDALSHLIEAYVSINTGPVGLDAMILDGIQRIGRWLRVAVAQPGHHEAREQMMLAAMLGGIAISSKWLGACHALAHPLSGIAGVHHGVACALMLPPQMRFSLIGAVERYAQIAHALNPSYAGAESTRQRAERAAVEVEQLMKDIGLPLRLRDAGVTAEMLPPLAEAAYQDLNWTTNPRVPTAQDMAVLYREVF